MFCKGSCNVNAGEDDLRCEECNNAFSARLLRFQQGLFSVAISHPSQSEGEEEAGKGVTGMGWR